MSTELLRTRENVKQAEGWLRDALEDHLESPSEATVDCLTEMAVQYQAEHEELRIAEGRAYSGEETPC